jgi:F-type H+-transporting ATPase subunit a
MELTRSKKFFFTDLFYIAGMCIPLLVGMTLKILTEPPTDGINITGARIYFTLPFPIQDIIISEAQINSWLVIIFILFFCLYMTHGLTVECSTRRQHLAEWIIETVDHLVIENMGPFFSGYSAFIISILALSAVSSLLSLIGLFPPTSDINVVGGWALLTFILITYYKLKGGFGNYLKGFTEPIFIMAPLNVLGEIATPISMAFRHYGNVLSGSVIAVLIAAALQGLSSLLLGWLPGFLGEIPFLQIGLPAVLSAYFDVFSGCMQAYIFAMLTAMYVSGAFNADEYFLRKQKKLTKQKI